MDLPRKEIALREKSRCAQCMGWVSHLCSGFGVAQKDQVPGTEYPEWLYNLPAS